MKDFYTNKKLNEIANEVAALMPSLRQFYESDESLFEYSQRINSYQPNQVHLKRQKKFKSLIKGKVESIFTKEEIKKIHLPVLSMENKGIISGTVEHHGILDHPLLTSVALVSNFYRLFKRDEYGDILTFATSNIPFNEPFRRRGFMFQGKRVNLVRDADKDKVIYGLGKMSFDFVQLMKNGKLWHNFSREEQVFLEEINRIIASIDYSTCKTVSDQFTKMNFYLWPFLFSEDLRGELAGLISLEYDEIAADYFIDILEHEQDSFIYHMLFDGNFRDLVLEEFRGVPGAWNEEGDIGTYFFWGIDARNERIRLMLRGGRLVGVDKDFSMEFNQGSIVQALRDRKILLGMLLKFSTLLFYMGVKPLMGYSIEYLTRTKQRLFKLLSRDFSKEAGLIASLPLDNMNLISICKLTNKNNILEDAHVFDVIYSKGFTEEYFEKLGSIKFKDFLIPSLLFAYQYGLSKYGNPKDKKDFTISETDLQEYLGNLLA